MAREAAAAPTADPYQALNRALDGSALTPMHWKIWWLSAMGVFLDGFDLFIIAVAMPIIVMDMSASSVNVLMNLGPNATTFILPAELFSTEVRASGHGFAAGAAKLGAALGIFLLPILKARIGLPNLLYVLALVCLSGLAITVIFHVETSGRDSKRR
jgi:MFS family permease